MPTEPLIRAAATLEARLTAVIAADWDVRDVNEKDAPISGPVTIHYEQQGFETTVYGTKLPPGFVGVEFMLTVEAHDREPVDAIETVTAATAALLPCLDAMSDLYWSTGTREVLTTGTTVYRVPVTLIVTYRATTAPNPEE